MLRVWGILLAGVLLFGACGNGDPVTGLYPISAAQSTLEAGDLEEGWELADAPDPDGGEEEDEPTPEVGFAPCENEAVAQPFEQSLADETAQFTRGRQVMASQVGVFSTVEDAGEAFSRYFNAFADCDEWSVTDDDATTQFRLTPIEMPRVGNEIAGHRLLGEVTIDGAATVTATLISEVAMFRQQNVIVTVAQSTVGLVGMEIEIEPDETIGALRAVHARITALETVEGPLA